MERYRNFSGDSGVAAYEIHRSAIGVAFVDGATYLYTDASAGASRVARMKRLARAGRGLSTYISRMVREDYAEKVR